MGQKHWKKEASELLFQKLAVRVRRWGWQQTNFRSLFIPTRAECQMFNRPGRFWVLLFLCAECYSLARQDPDGLNLNIPHPQMRIASAKTTTTTTLTGVWPLVVPTDGNILLTSGVSAPPTMVTPSDWFVRGISTWDTSPSNTGSRVMPAKRKKKKNRSKKNWRIAKNRFPNC